MSAPETPRPTAQGEGVAGGATNYNERIVHVSLSLNEVTLITDVLDRESRTAIRLDRHDHADRCDDLAARISGAVPASEVVAADDRNARFDDARSAVVGAALAFVGTPERREATERHLVDAVAAYEAAATALDVEPVAS